VCVCVCERECECIYQRERRIKSYNLNVVLRWLKTSTTIYLQHIKANISELVEEPKLNQYKVHIVCQVGSSYRHLRYTNNIHIPLVVLSAPSSCHSFITPTLSYTKPFQWKGYRFSGQEKTWRSNSGICTWIQKSYVHKFIYNKKFPDIKLENQLSKY
jgi:hypothetical protein